MICARQRWGAFALSAMLLAFTAWPAYARDAAFMDPGSAGGANANEAVRVEPKSEIDIGDSPLNIARRTTLFFVNQSNAPVHVDKLTVNSDSNVSAELSNDDCSKQGTLPSASRCSVEVSITPSSGGTWSVEILMTHSGAGRLTRARVTGKTTGAGTGDKKETGLFLNAKDSKPVDFGEVEIGEGKTVRSALMVNDSPEPITLYSIDVIEAENGLERLDQGCAVDMELKPGESCPVTLVWAPTSEGHVSTDLIIRHSGRLGFAVIPIRGVAKGASADTGKGKENSKNDTASKGIPLPGKPDLDKMADKMAPVAAAALDSGPTLVVKGLHLIGTVGARGVFFKPDGTTAVAQKGDDIDMGDETAKVVSISSRSAQVIIHGKKKELMLEAVKALTEKARAAREAERQTQQSPMLGLPSDGKNGSSALLPGASTSSGIGGYGGMR